MLNDLKNNPGVRIIAIGALANLLLAALKIAGGIFGKSTAMLADGIHSLSDLLTDVVVLFTHKIGQMPADENHPYGHGRAETIGATLVGAVIIVAGLGLAYESWSIINTGVFRTPLIPAALAAVLSIVINEVLFRYTRTVGEETNSPSLVANAWHHRSDAISSVAALVGIGGAMSGYPIMDPIAAIIVSVMIAKVGYNIAFKGLSDLMDTALSEEETRRIETMINGLPGVIQTHNLRTRRIGGDTLVDVHILVDHEASVTEGHHIAEGVRRELIRTMDNVQDVLVHVDTEDDAAFESIYWANRSYLEKQVEPMIASMKDIQKRTHLRAHHHGGKTTLEVFVKMREGLDPDETQSVVKELQEHLQTIEHVHKVRVFIDTNSS
ncbi:MAG: cation diffusion facilitator family transporter [Nitrospinota bacterium]|nr:cation diffusion facilitator family transporter [Nitrospinota bacterium]